MITVIILKKIQIPFSGGASLKSKPPGPHHVNTNKMTCAPSEDSDQPGHLPSLIRVFAVCMKKYWDLCYPVRERIVRTNQTGRMPRLILVFAGHTVGYVGFCYDVAQFSLSQ